MRIFIIFLFLLLSCSPRKTFELGVYHPKKMNKVELLTFIILYGDRGMVSLSTAKIEFKKDSTFTIKECMYPSDSGRFEVKNNLVKLNYNENMKNLDFKIKNNKIFCVKKNNKIKMVYYFEKNKN